MQDPEHPPSRQNERRRQRRVQLAEPLLARHIGLAEVFLVEEASLGGFSVRSAFAFEPGTEHHFRVESNTGQVAVVAVVCRYCTPIPDSPKTPHLVGFQFSPQPTKRLRLFLGAVAMDALADEEAAEERH